MVKLNTKPPTYDAALFYWYKDNELQGLTSVHVDDFRWGGSTSFQQEVIEPLRAVFEIEVEHSHSFKYIGLQLHQNRVELTTYLLFVFFQE